MDDWETEWFWERVFIITLAVILTAAIIFPSFSSDTMSYIPYDIIDTGYLTDGVSDATLEDISPH